MLMFQTMVKTEPNADLFWTGDFLISWACENLPVQTTYWDHICPMGSHPNCCSSILFLGASSSIGAIADAWGSGVCWQRVSSTSRLVSLVDLMIKGLSLAINDSNVYTNIFIYH